MPDLFRQISRNAHLVSRTAGDISAARRGVLVKRLIRRNLTRALFRALSGR